MTRPRLPLEQDVKEPRALVMEYTVRCQVQESVMPGMGSVARAVDDLTRYVTGQPNVDPRSIRFYFREDNHG